jgi:signal transduction histidine kinase
VLEESCVGGMSQVEMARENSYERPIIAFRSAVIVAAFFILSFFILSISLQNQEMQRRITTNILNIIVQLCATFCLFYGAYYSRAFGKRIQTAWIVLALAQLLFAIADIGFAYYDIYQGEVPFPSFADPPAIAFYFLFAAGLLLLPRSALTSGERTKILLDMGVVMVAAIMIFWALLIVPTIQSGTDESSLSMAFSVAYPVGDLLILFALLELLFRRMRSPTLTPIILLLCGSICLIAADFIYMGQSLQNAYISGGLLDLGWIIAYSFNGLAGISQANIAKSQTLKEFEQQTVQFGWPIYLPYVSAVAAYGLLIWSHVHPLPVGFDYLSWGVGAIIALIIIRQVVALNENAMLYDASVREVAERKKAEENVRKLNEELESRVIERTEQLQVANIDLQNEITEREKAQEELKKAHDGLEIKVNERTAELQSKNAEMERFIYTVSHDLRSPLVTIQGFQGFLREDVSANNEERVETDLKMIESAVSKMDNLLMETLELSRIGRVANPPEDVPFEDIVKDALMQTSARIRSEGVEIIVADDLPTVHADRARIVEALINLIENSIKYKGDHEPPKIEIGYQKRGREIVFFVRDNGMGIDSSQHQKVFELFYKVNKRSEGTGAGLAIVKRIIEVHGGRIWVESEIGKGTTMCFTLPLKSDR